MREIAALGPGKAAPEILAALREIDPRADLLHLGGQEWLLGVRADNQPAKDKLADQLKKAIAGNASGALDPAERALIEAELAKEIRVLQLCALGFRPIQLYTCLAPGFDIVRDFRLRDHNWRTRPEAAFQELKDEVATETHRKRDTDIIRDYFDAEGSSLWHKILRRARSFAAPRRVTDTTPTS